MNWTLRKCDRSILQASVRELDSITAAPSNLTDLYDINQLRAMLSKNEGDLRVLLDNNIATRILSLPVEGASATPAISNEHRRVCFLMAFFVYTGIETNPVLAMYEAESTNTAARRIEVDTNFRIYDHLPAQIFMDMAVGRSNTIPRAAWKAAEVAVNENPTTQNNISETAYDGEMKEHQFFYANTLKAWVLYKSLDNEEQALRSLLDWIHLNSVCDQTSILFFAILFSKNRLGKMIKKINSTNSQLIIKNCKNAAWDMCYLNAFPRIANANFPETIWLFCTRDNLCQKLLRTSMSVKDEDTLDTYLKKHFTENAYRILKAHLNKHNNRENRSEYFSQVQNSIPETIIELEMEVSNLLSIE